MNLIGFYSIQREIHADKNFKHNLMTYFLYLCSEAMFQEFESSYRGISISLKAGQFWKSLRERARDCRTPKNTIEKWDVRLQKMGYITIEKLDKKGDTKSQKEGHQEPKKGTLISVITIRKYLVIRDVLQKQGTPIPHFRGHLPPEKGDKNKNTNKKTNNSEQLIFSIEEKNPDSHDLALMATILTPGSTAHKAVFKKAADETNLSDSRQSADARSLSDTQSTIGRNVPSEPQKAERVVIPVGGLGFAYRAFKRKNLVELEIANTKQAHYDESQA